MLSHEVESTLMLVRCDRSLRTAKACCSVAQVGLHRCIQSPSEFSVGVKLLSAFEAGLLIALWAFPYDLIKSHVVILLVRQARVRFICNRLRNFLDLAIMV